MNVKLKVTKTESLHKAKAELFNARATYTTINYNLPLQYCVELESVSENYKQKFGETRFYHHFLADCFKYNFTIDYVNGEAITSINPFKDSFILPDFTNELIIDFKLKVNE